MNPFKLRVSAIAFLGLLAGAKAQSIKLDSGLVAHFTFDNHTNDVTENGHNGVGYGLTSATGHCGRLNTALYFNGTNNSYIEIPDHADLRPKVLSISYWINLPTSNAAVIFFKSRYSDAMYEQYSMPYNHYLVSGKPEQVGFHFGFKQKGYCESPGYGWDATYTRKQVSLNTWHFVVALFDGTLLKVFVDGALASESPSTYSEMADCAGGSLKIGKAWQNYPVPFEGLLDDFRIYNRALSLEEIKALYKECQITTSTEADEANGTNKSLVLGSNPSQSGIFEIENRSATLSSQVFDPLGNLIDARILAKGTTMLDLSAHPSGIYVLRTEKGILKLIKQ